MKQMWYVATLIMRCKVGDHKAESWTYDEQIRLIRAPDEDTAYDKAAQMGKNEEHVYENVYGERVAWEFVGLADLAELGSQSIHDGTEIRSRMFKGGDPMSMVVPKEKLSVYLAQHRQQYPTYEVVDQ